MGKKEDRMQDPTEVPSFVKKEGGLKKGGKRYDRWGEKKKKTKRRK